MSHSVTVTRTTTTTSGSALFINTGFLKTTSGLLKLAQLVLGAVCLGIVGYYYQRFVTPYYSEPELFLFLVAFAFVVGTFSLVVSCLFSLSTATILSKTLLELVYHALGFALYLAAGLTLLIKINSSSRKRYSDFEPYVAASVIGLVLAGLYLFSAVLAHRAYRGI